MVRREKLRQSRILIVDDAPDNVAMLEMLLQTAQYRQLCSTSDPFRALPLFHEFQPDLILLDLMMPGLDGFEVMAQLRPLIAPDTSLPILVLTGDDSAEAKQRALAGGAQDFLGKPFDPTEVLLRIQNLLQTRWLHLDLQQKNQALEEQVQEVNRHRVELQSALVALAASEERWRLALEAARLGTWDWQLPHDGEQAQKEDSGAIAPRLAACQVRLRGPHENFTGRFEDLLARIDPADQRGLQAILARAMQAGSDYELEFRLRHQQAGTRWYVARGHAVRETDERTGDSRTSVLGVVMDITERKAAEQALKDSREQLRALTQRLETSIEAERTRIAREIHDELGSLMTGLKMDMRSLQDWVSLPAAAYPTPMTTEVSAPEPASPAAVREEVWSRLDGMSHMVQDMVRIVRQVATELRPSSLDDLGLEAAMEWQVQEFQRRTGIPCAFTAALDDLEAPPQVATALFRILQEALTNIMRHAQATQVHVLLARMQPTPTGAANPPLLRLRVQDNGRGITMGEVANLQSLGLLGMRERASLFDGQVTVRGIPGHGTTVEVYVPV